MHPKIRLFPLLAALLSTVPGILSAQLGVSGKLATTGVGFDVTHTLAYPVNLRVGYSRLGITTGHDVDENLSLNLTLESVPILLDWHLLDNSFRLTGGLFYNRNRFSLSARANDLVEVGNSRFRIEEYSIRVDTNDFAPYLGFGWGRANDPTQRLAFAFDFGILFQGEPSVGGRATALNSDQQDQLDRAFQAELDSRRSDFSWLRYYPVISLGISFRF